VVGLEYLIGDDSGDGRNERRCERGPGNVEDAEADHEEDRRED
jgi:hypothetical protein